MALPNTPTGRALLGLRTALGVSTLLAPRLAGRAFLLDPDDNPQLPVIGRLWGRGAVLGPAAALMAAAAVGATTLGALSVAGESEQAH